MSASWALQISHSGRPFFHSTHAAPGSSPQKMSDMPTVEARPRRSTTRPKRIVMLCATYLFYCDPQASFPLFFAADRVSLHRKRQVSRKRPIQTSNEYQPIADARNCELLRVRRPHSIEQAFCQAQSEAAPRNPPESREEHLQSLVRNREPGATTPPSTHVVKLTPIQEVNVAIHTFIFSICASPFRRDLGGSYAGRNRIASSNRGRSRTARFPTSDPLLLLTGRLLSARFWWEGDLLQTEREVKH